jgi:hypothetical protein
VSILLLIILLLSSCGTTVNSCNLPLQRLTIIQVDCIGKTYGECIANYDSALKQSNADKTKILELSKWVK